MVRDFDDLLERLGSYGPYQKKLLGLFFFPISFIIGITSSLVIFQFMVPDYWCHAPGRLNTTYDSHYWRNLSIPRSNDSMGYAKCQMYSYRWEDNNTTVIFTNNTQECKDGYEFDHQEFTATIATTFEWVCEKDHYSHTALSVYIAGNTFGTFILPIIADKFLGRRLVFYLALLIHVVFTLPVIFASNYHLHLVLRFAQGLSFETNYLMPYIIVMELISVDKRALVAMLSFIAWTFGMCVAALICWLLPQWQYMALITAIPSALGFLYWRFLPESPRWLLARGDVQGCTAVLRKINRDNRTGELCSSELESECEKLTALQPPDVSLLHALSYPKLTIRTVVLILISFSQFAVYGVLYFGIDILPKNSFLSHFILSIFELPSNFLGWFFIHFLGRRFTCYVTYMLVAIFCIGASFSTHEPWLLLTLLATVKLFATQGIYIVFVMASEILPTPIRTSGFGITLVFGMMGMAVAPYILNAGLGEMFKYWMMLGLTGLSLAASLLLPETIGLPLPQTFQDAEDLGRDRPFTTWIHHWNQHQYPPPPTASAKQNHHHHHDSLLAK